MTAFGIYGLMLLGAVVLGSVVVKIVRHAADVSAVDKEVRVSQGGNGRWFYRFNDPWGSMIVHGGYRTETAARRAGARSRHDVARHLGNMVGL